jgi:hypothetical protein
MVLSSVMTLWPGLNYVVFHRNATLTVSGESTLACIACGSGAGMEVKYVPGDSSVGVFLRHPGLNTFNSSLDPAPSVEVAVCFDNSTALPSYVTKKQPAVCDYPVYDGCAFGFCVATRTASCTNLFQPNRFQVCISSSSRQFHPILVPFRFSACARPDTPARTAKQRSMSVRRNRAVMVGRAPIK